MMTRMVLKLFLCVLAFGCACGCETDIDERSTSSELESGEDSASDSGEPKLPEWVSLFRNGTLYTCIPPGEPWSVVAYLSGNNRGKLKASFESDPESNFECDDKLEAMLTEEQISELSDAVLKVPNAECIEETSDYCSWMDPCIVDNVDAGYGDYNLTCCGEWSAPDVHSTARGVMALLDQYADDARLMTCIPRV